FVRFGRQERKDIIRRLPLLDLANRGPARPDASEKWRWSAFVEGPSTDWGIMIRVI
ncbi:MAG: hypothetical protein QOD93_611, partial [Acetobacteraceae bacterium]|nr:hypothetical protein [Acetobacteraceae bacterium]